MAREHHLAHGREQPAVGAVVVSEYPAFLPQHLHGVEERLEPFRVHVRGARPELAVRLRQRRAAEAALPRTQIREQKLGLAAVGSQLRRERRPRVGYRREGRHDQGERGDHLPLRSVLPPRRLHGQAVLADRYADSEARAQIHGDGAHGVEQRSVFPGMPRRRHPVRGELDVSDVVDGRRRDVGDRLAYRHAPGGLGAHQRERRALPHRKCLAAAGVEAHQRDRHVRDRHLPRSDHLVARGQAADGPIADRDEKRLVGDCRKPEHPVGRVAQPYAGRLEGRQLPPLALDPPRHPRRLAEQHRELHVDRVVPEERVGHGQAAVARRSPDDCERAALALANNPKSAPGYRARWRARSAPEPRCTRSAAETCRALRWGSRAGRHARPARRRAPSRARRSRRPPAPTSWIESIGLASPSARQESITSCARR